MNNYILKKGAVTLHFFTIPNQGLVLRKKELNLWHNHRVLLPDSKGAFSVFQDESGTITLVSLTDKNEIYYTILGESEEKSFLLTKLKEDMEIKSISLFKTPIAANIVYTAQYRKKLLLVHCILGDNAMPDTIDEIQSEDYFIHNHSVYYTNSNGILGYKNLSDGKADIFNSITSGATEPYLYNYRGRDFLTYQKNNKIYLQNRLLTDDPGAKNPIITESDGALLVMWQKGDFIRYVSSFDNGESFGPPMQYVSSGKIPTLINVISKGRAYRYFATISKKEIHIFGSNNPFSITNTEKNHRQNFDNFQ